MMVGFLWIVLLSIDLGSLGTLGNGNQFYYQEVPIPDPAYRYKNKQKRESSLFYEVEALIIVDLSLYQRIRNIIRDFLPYVYDSSVIGNLYNRLIDRVNQRFSLLDDSEFKIRIAVNRTYYCDTLQNTPWSSTIEHTSEIGVTKALDEMNSYLREGRIGDVPKNAIVIALTAMKLLDNSSRAVQGISQYGSICNGSNIIILQETFDFILVTVATHYIARSMGAHEDGKENNCSADNHFIMSTPNMAITGETKSNPWRFSECSTREIKTFISSLSNACFTRLTNKANIALDSAGTNWTVDQQCKIIKGTPSYMCRVLLGGKYEEMCTGMYCYNATNNMCELVVPRERTLCGDGKWCSIGVCSSSYLAPSAIAECVHGDQPVLEFSTTDCNSYISIAPSECYKGNVSLTCCQTCKAHASGTKDCLYGDRIGSCKTISARDCYNDTINTNCCQTCRTYSNYSEANCKYGDRAASCKSITPRDCYDATTNRECCKSCSYYNSYSPNCEYGDRIPVCSLSVGDCYDSSINMECCKKCQYNRTFALNCEYGNRIASCQSILGLDCYNASINRDCCQTCLSFKTAYSNCLYGDYVSGCRTSECSTYSADKLKQCCGTCRASLPNKQPDNQTTDSHETVTDCNIINNTSNDGWVAPVVGTIVGVVILAVGVTSVLCYLRRRQRLKKPQQVQQQQQQLKDVTSNRPSVTPTCESQSNRPPMTPPRDSQEAGISLDGDAEEPYSFIYPNDIKDSSGTAANTSVKYDIGYSNNRKANDYIEPVRSKQYSTSFGYEVTGTSGTGEDHGYLHLGTDVDATILN